MAELSNQLMVVTVLAYLAAMVCHAAEYSFGARSHIGRAGTRQHGFEQGQRHRDARAPQHHATIEQARLHDSGTCRRLNGTLCTMPRITLRTR